MRLDHCSQHGAHRQGRFALRNGNPALVIGDGGLRAAFGMEFGPGGNLFVADGDTVLEYDGGTGNFVGQFVTPGDGGMVLRIESALERELPRIEAEGFNYDVPTPSWAQTSAADALAMRGFRLKPPCPSGFSICVMTCLSV